MIYISKQNTDKRSESPLRKYWITYKERILCAVVLMVLLLAGMGTAGDEEADMMLEGHFGGSTYEPETELSSSLTMLVGLIVVTVIGIAIKKESIIKLFKER